MCHAVGNELDYAHLELLNDDFRQERPEEGKDLYEITSANLTSGAAQVDLIPTTDP